MGDYQTNTNQQGDVLLYHGAEDRGDINEANGLIEMTTGFETMAYLALFGGNDDDDGTAATEKQQWWGNEGEPDEQQYRGRFQSYLTGEPITSATLPEMEAAAIEDLAAAFVPLYAESVTCSLSLVTPKMVKAEIQINLYNAEPVLIALEVEA